MGNKDQENIKIMWGYGIAFLIIGLLSSVLFKAGTERGFGYFMIVIGCWATGFSYIGAHNGYNLEKRLWIVCLASLSFCILGAYSWYLFKPDHSLGHLFVAIGSLPTFFCSLALATIEKEENGNNNTNNSPAESQ